MPYPINYTLQGLMPCKWPNLASTTSVALPAGGPVGVGGAYAQGQALDLVGGTAQAEIRTLTLTKGGSTGLRGYFVYYGDRVFSGLSTPTTGLTANLVSAFPTAAQIQAALVAAVPMWDGNLTVTGSDTANYTITFNNLMSQKRVGGLLQFNVYSQTGGTTATGAITTAQQGSVGAAQYDVYVSGGSVDAALQNYTLLDPVGDQPTEFGDVGQPMSGYAAWDRGFFYVDAPGYPGIVGLDAAALTVAPYKLILANGTSLTDAGAIVQLR